MSARVDLWTWRLDGPDDPDLRAVLNDEERARADRYINRQDRKVAVAGRGRLRMILGCYAGVAPESLVFTQGPHGKPDLADGSGPAFNFSDTGSLGCLAVLVEGPGPIGVDIEAMRPRDYLKLAERYFATAEQDVLRSLDAAEHGDAFFRGWTRKEAFLKAVGTGLSTRLDAFETTITRDAPPRMLRIDPAYFPRVDASPDAWRLHSFTPAPGHMGALAVMTGGAELDMRVREVPQ